MLARMVSISRPRDLPDSVSQSAGITGVSYCARPHSTIDEHLGWFQVFAIVNSATINIRVHVSL